MNKIRSSNDAIEAILTLLETMSKDGTNQRMRPEDFGVDSIYYYKMDNKRDPERKEFFKVWLEGQGYTDVTIIEWEFSPYDIYAKNKNGEDCVFELKNRAKYSETHSTDWNDSIIDEKKFNELMNLPYKAYVVNFFTDLFCIHSIDEEYEIQHQPRCRANMDWDQHIVSKNIVSYKHKEKNKYEYDRRMERV